MATSVKPTQRKDRRKYLAFVPGMEEAVNEPLYDFQTYALAGTTNQYRFFTIPQGQSSKTLADTNMTLSGQLPAGLQFEVRAIEFALFPGVLPALGQQNSAAVGGIAAAINDVWQIFKNGYVQFTILSKAYLTFAPIGQAPYTRKLDIAGMQSDTTTAGAAQLNRVAYASLGGAQFQITPVTITSNMNFDVTAYFPTTTAISADARFGCILRGIKSRLSQ